MKKVLAILMAVVLVVGIFAGCGKSGGGSHPVNKTYTEAIDLTMKLLAGKPLNQTEAKKMQAEKFFAYSVDFSEYYADVQRQCKINENTMIAAFGKDYAVSYEIISNKELSAEERYTATKHLNSEVWFDAAALSEVRELELKVSFTGEDLNKEFDMGIQIMKIGDGWYILSVEYDEMVEFFGW